MSISAIEIFHYMHEHYMNEHAREEDNTITTLPEEKNPLFYVFPICILLSLVLMILWIFKKIVHARPVIVNFSKIFSKTDEIYAT